MIERRANSRQVAGTHYGLVEFQHWDFVELNHIPFIEATAAKYVARWRKKDGVKDLDKALHYTEKLVEVIRAGGRGAMDRPPRQLLRWDDYVVANNLNQVEQLAVKALCLWRNEFDLRRVRDAIDLLKTGPEALDLKTGQSA